MEELAFRNFFDDTKKHSFLFFILAKCSDKNSETKMKKITCDIGSFVGGSTSIGCSPHFFICLTSSSLCLFLFSNISIVSPFLDENSPMCENCSILSYRTSAPKTSCNFAAQNIAIGKLYRFPKT